MNVTTQNGTATAESISSQPAAIIRVKEKETTSSSTTTTDENGQPSQIYTGDEISLDNVEDVGKLLINTRVKKIRPLVPPQILEEEIPL
jgi:hypothetical protein